MRSSLLHPLAERQPRRHRPKRQAEHRVGRLPARALKREAKLAISAPEGAELAIAAPEEAKLVISARQPLDIVVERVRAAGGPLDEASYVCECGYLFAAPVSTTVVCPHCSAPQAW
jgi:hypothetical protein